MKHSARLLSLCLCVALLLGLSSCVRIGSGDEDTPEGMQIASAAGSDYLLYVPTTWVVNTAYGISGAYRDLSRQSSVSMMKYPITDVWSAEMEAATVGGDTPATSRFLWFFLNECLRPVRASALDGKVSIDEEAADLLDKTDAYRFCYSALVGGKTYRYRQLVTEKNGAFYVFTFTATEEMYENYLGDVEKILNAFRFTEKPYYPKDFAKTPDKGEAPAGMQACFGDDVAYRMYIPAEWVIDPDSSVWAAYVKEDRSSVSMVPYRPTAEHLSVAEYFDMICKQTEQLLGADAMRIDESKTHKEPLGSREATVWEYTCVIGGVTYRCRQYIAAYRSMMYNLTYMATAENFDKHTADVDRIVAAFSFR